MLRDLTAQWEKDRLSATPIYIDWTCPQPHLFSKRHWLTGKNAYTWIDGKEATGAGTEPYLSDGGSILWTLYCGVFGLHPDFQGITFKPHIPQQLADTEIGIRLMGKKIDIHYHGHGEKIAELKVAGKSIKSDRILWQDFPDNLTIDIDFPA
ncbi:MAG: hypothetical protein KJ692_07465, partial [Verrucomicrobia bacterium]|nr:hypothetical protein [Verrucomicrobiota bacterium]